jgi:DNA-binding Lrp family transcriptional regulator
VDKELQAYYEARFDMMASKGWKDLLEDLQKVAEVSRDLDRCTSVEDLYYAKGQLDILNFILKLKQASEDAYEELTA